MSAEPINLNRYYLDISTKQTRNNEEKKDWMVTGQDMSGTQKGK